GADAEIPSSLDALSYEPRQPLISNESVEAIVEKPERPPLILPIQTQYSVTEAVFPSQKQERAPLVTIIEPKVNPFSVCEFRSAAENKNELCNVDFLVRLNFYAQRLTEEIAEAAGNDLLAKIRVCENPRARYFDEDVVHFYSRRSSSEDGQSEVCSQVDPSTCYEVHPIVADKPDTFAGSLISFFQRRSSSERPKSAMAIIQASRPLASNQLDSLSRRSSTDRPATSGGDIMELVRRASVSSEKTNDSTFALPENALLGLSDAEKQHIIKVLSAANRSQMTPQQSRRSSSSMYTLPELESLDVDEQERKHIEEVIQKAEQRQAPFIIKKIDEECRKISSVVSTVNNESDSVECFSENVKPSTTKLEAEIDKMRCDFDLFGNKRTLERIDSQSEISSERHHSSSIEQSLEEIQTLPKIISSVEKGDERRKSLSPSFFFGSVRSLFGKALDSVSSEKSTDGSRRLSAPITTGTIYSPITPEHANTFISGIQESETENEETELQIDNKKIKDQSFASNVYPEITPEELEHINRINAMAEAEANSSAFIPAMIQPQKQRHSFGLELDLNSKLKSAFQAVNTVTEKLSTAVENITENEQKPVKPVGIVEEPQEMELTDAELEHIARINQLAEQEFQQNFAGLKQPQPELETSRTPSNIDVIEKALPQTIDESIGKENNIYPSTVPFEPLTEEELEHIRRITELAEMDERSPLLSKQNAKVDESTLNDKQKDVNQTTSDVVEEQDITLNEAKMEEKEVELTESELEHIRKIAALAEQDDLMNNQLQQRDFDKNKIEEQQKEFLNFTTTTDDFSNAEPSTHAEINELSQEEIDHIQKINEKANADLAHLSPTDVRFWSDDFSAQYQTTTLPVSNHEKTNLFDAHFPTTLGDDTGDLTVLDEIKNMKTIEWYGQQLNQLNRSLDEVDDYGMFPESNEFDAEEMDNLISEKETIPVQVSAESDSTKPAVMDLQCQKYEQEEEEFPCDVSLERDTKINKLAAAEADRALNFATGAVFPSSERSKQTSVPLPHRIQTEEYGLKEKKEKWEESSFAEPLPLPPTFAVDAVSLQVDEPERNENDSECREEINEIPIITASQNSNQIVKSAVFPEKKAMFGSKSKTGGFGGFGGLSKFASDALKNAKQAGEQLGAKAAQAAQAASTGDLTQIGRNLQETIESKSQAQIGPSINKSTISLPPGLEDLSQEERDKIMAVMACAEIDAAEAPPLKISASRTDDKLFKQTPTTPTLIAKPQPKSTSLLDLSTGPSTSISATPSIEELGLGHLSAAEQEQILSVMRQAEMQGASMVPLTAMSPQRSNSQGIPFSATIVHEQLNDKDGSKTRKLSWENGQLIEQPLHPLPNETELKNDKFDKNSLEGSISSMASSQPQLMISDSGYATYDTDLDKHVLLQEVHNVPVTTEEISQPMLPESFEIDEEPEESIYKNEEFEPEVLPKQNLEELEDWSKPEILQQYGGMVITEPEEKVDESIRITEAAPTSPHVDAVELDDDVWMQPRHEYKAPEHWETKTGRMWTTVFSDDNESIGEESDKQSATKSESYVNEEEAKRFSSDIDWSIEHGNQKYDQPGITRSIAQEFTTSNLPMISDIEPSTSDDHSDLYEKPRDLHYEVQMDDLMSPTIVVSTSEVPTPQQKIEPIKEPQMPMEIKKAHTVEPQKQVRSPPEIKVTVHDEKDKTSDEESEDETPPSSDEDDYPDQIIEAPSAPSMSFTEMEHERETQSAFAQEVLQQIQSFGESANDEFEWKKENKIQEERKPEIAPLQPAPLPTTNAQEDFHYKQDIPSEQSSRQPSQRINPFLESPEDEEPDTVHVEQNQLDSDDIDYVQAAQYYRTYNINDRIEQQQQQRKISTIPEGEEEDNVVNTEGRYHAKELERKPLHGNTIPPLITSEDKKPKQRFTKSYIATTTTTVTTTAVATTFTPTTGFYGTSQPFYISAGSSAPTYTWATTTPVCSQEEKLQQIQKPTKQPESQIKVQIPEVTSAEPIGPLTPIRNAPPPPEQEQQFTVFSTANNVPSINGHQFKTDIPVAEDLIPIQNHHPLHPHVHLKDQVTQPGYFQHDFVPPNSASDAAILAQIGLQSISRQTLGSQLPSAIHSFTEMTDDSTTSRLKRSPAMILSNDEQPTKVFNFPPPTFSGISSMTSQQAPTTVTADGISTGVLLKRPFVRDEDVLLLISGENAVPTTSTSTSIEMGRRRLPSLPQPYMGTNISNAPIYYTSSAPEPKDAACGTNGGILFDSSTASTTTRLSSNIRTQPSQTSATAHPSSAIGVHPIDPAILPGATFKIPNRSKQTIIIPNGDISKQRKLPKMTDTMSRVMLKKELREVLSKRRDKLDTVEIEANHRQYVINRMLNSGIMPEGRLPELDEIPSVIKCDLPLDIVKNAKIVPIKRPPISIRRDYKPQMKSEGTSTINWVEEEGIKQFNITSTIGLKKSIAVQCDVPPKSIGTSTLSYVSHYLPSTSLKQQIQAETNDYGRMEKRTIETQTDAISDSLKRKKFPKPTSSISQRNTTTTSTGPDLLESTQRYFEEYDRRLREATQAVKLDKQRFNFTENDIESKRQQILDELAQRREKISSMIDLRYLQQQPLPKLLSNPMLPSSDYASTVPHYGSLPRIDYPARNRLNTGLRDFSSRSNQNQMYNYGSLPRNYERYLDSMEQSLMAPTMPNVSENYSRSLSNLNQMDSYYPQYLQQQQQQQPQMFTRSANQIDQMPFDDMFLSGNLNQIPSNVTGRGDMVSQYANYLNNQFLSAQRDAYDDQMAMTNQLDYSPPMPPPMKDINLPYNQPRPYYSSNPMLDQSIPNYLNQTDQMMFEQPGPSQVYSRNERNYGSRPSQMIGDYGNYMHNRVQSLRQLDNIQDLINHNVGVVPEPLPTNNYNPPTYNYQPSQWDNGYNATYQQQQRYLQQQQQQQQGAARKQTAMNTSVYDAKYPCEDGLNKMYHTYGRHRQRTSYGSSYGYQTDYLQPNSTQQYSTASLGRDMRGKINNNITTSSRGRSMTNIGREINDLLRDLPETRSRRHVQSGRIKRILLTRKYKDQNIYNDLGIRVTGGKRLSNGDLGAFVTAVNRGRGFETLGEIQEGDQVLEWNGILLSGKTFEEVERIITGSLGEVEIVIKSNRGINPYASQQEENLYDNVTEGYKSSRRYETNNYWSKSNAPPIPAHRSFSPNYSERYNYLGSGYGRQNNVYQSRNVRDGLGIIQLAFAYDQINGILLVSVLGARNLRYRDYGGRVILPNPFVKIYLLPGRKAVNKRRTKYICNTTDPDWQQTVEYYLNYNELPNYYLEFTVWDYGKQQDKDNICLGQVFVSLSDTSILNNIPMSFPLQRPDQNAVVHGLSNTPTALTTRLRTQSYYNPTNLDLGYPAIC
uniref:Uncharacterized protein n=1 Tax=Panagrolaimus sp. JU765 TaxID=591449 RepID=A0AC34PZ65_9BILA